MTQSSTSMHQPPISKVAIASLALAAFACAKDPTTADDRNGRDGRRAAVRHRLARVVQMDVARPAHHGQAGRDPPDRVGEGSVGRVRRRPLARVRDDREHGRRLEHRLPDLHGLGAGRRGPAALPRQQSAGPERLPRGAAGLLLRAPERSGTSSSSRASRSTRPTTTSPSPKRGAAAADFFPGGEPPGVTATRARRRLARLLRASATTPTATCSSPTTTASCSAARRRSPTSRTASATRSSRSRASRRPCSRAT